MNTQAERAHCACRLQSSALLDCDTTGVLLQAGYHLIAKAVMLTRQVTNRLLAGCVPIYDPPPDSPRPVPPSPAHAPSCPAISLIMSLSRQTLPGWACSTPLTLSHACTGQCIMQMAQGMLMHDSCVLTPQQQMCILG
jgi:hypothetical protein